MMTVPGRGLRAQSPNWSSVLSIMPNPSPYLADWERVPSTAFVSLTYTGATAADFKVRVTLTSNERGLIGTTESPKVTVPNGPATFLYNVRDAVFEWTTVSRNAALTDAARRTGQIPEGTYQACARVFVGTATTPATEACASFSILQPDPPQLLMPRDREVVASTTPFFQWTPVLAPPTVAVSYQLTVVELIGSQVPRAAIDANIPVYKGVSRSPFVIYPIDALRLERTKRYAWQIRAVDDAGRQLFRDGAQSEIHVFEVSNELLDPTPKAEDIPDSLVLIPGVAQLIGLRAAKIQRAATDILIDGDVTLQFLGATGAKDQQIYVQGLRAAYRGAFLTLVSGKVQGRVPDGLLAKDLQSMVTFAPLVFTPATGFTATATLALPGVAPVPLSGTVQLTAAGLSGRLEGSRATKLPITRVGRAPVQYAANTARLVLPEGRLEFVGKVLLFEQDVGCPASGTLESGVVRLPVYCDPTSGFRPDTSSARSLLTFGTLAGDLAADFLTDTLGTNLRGPATFSVFGDANRSCALSFTLIFARDEIKRDDEQSSCAVGDAIADFGWVKLGVSNLRIDRLDYAPGATLAWRARVDLDPTVRGADNLQLGTIRDVLLDNEGIHMPSTSSSAPGTSTSGYNELDGVGVLPRTMGFRGGSFTYARWLSGRDPGFEWGSGTSWISLPLIANETSTCINELPFEVDTLIIKGARIDAPLKSRAIDPGCRVRSAPNFHVFVKNVSGRVTIALDSAVRALSLPTISGNFIDPRLDCGDPVFGCFGSTGIPMTGEVHLNQHGRLLGNLSDFAPTWAKFELKFAQLELKGGSVVLGVDTAGAQSAIYDGSVKVSFGKIDEPKKESDKSATDATKTTTTDPSKTATTTATGAASSLGVSAPGSEAAEVTARAKIDYVHSKLMDGRFTLPGPFALKLGFFNFVVSEATLDTTGLSIDGRQKLLADSTTVDVKPGTGSNAKPDSSWSSKTDTVGVTFARVRLDPATGDISAGSITLDANLALESTPLGVGSTLLITEGAGLIGGGQAKADSALAPITSSARLFDFHVVRANAPFNPKFQASLFQFAGGNVRIGLPGSPVIDAGGLRLNGVAPAAASFANRTFEDVSVSFESNFGIRAVAGTVSQGRALFKVKQYPIAYVDPSGWHVALAELVQTIIPDTLFLFDAQSAYVVLRDSAKQLLVDVNETPEGPRITTRTGTAVKLVIPALKGSRQSAPAANITMDMTLAKGTWRPVAGEIKAAAGGSPDDDFADNDFPFELDSVVFRATRGADPTFFAHGRIDVWPGEFKPMRVSLGFGGAGEITANVEQAFVDSLPLVSGSALVKFHIDTLRFSAHGKLGPSFQWQLETPGRLAYYDTDKAREFVLARATFRLSPSEAALVNFAASDSLTTVRLPGVDLNLGRIRAPTFRWDFAGKRFDFELLFDVGLMVPALDSMRLPEIRDIRLTPQGLVIPAFEMASTPVSTDPNSPFVPALKQLRVGGFSVKALAYRVGEFRWNWLAGAPPPQLNFGVDLEFGIEDLPSGVEGQAARIAIRALNVGITNGQLSGTFERIDIPTPIRTPVADIRGAFGSFRIRDGQAPDISIGILADLRLPDVLACPDAAARKVSLDSPRDTLFLASNGTLRGTIQNVVPRCTMAVGPFDVQFGASTVRFGYDPSTQHANVDLDAAVTLRVPSVTPGQTFSATGRLAVDIDQPRIVSASIAIDQPFSWSPDPANPFLKLIVSQASLSATELRFGATGQLRTAQGAGVDVAFEGVAFDLNDLKLKSGRIRLTADAAVGFEMPSDGSLLFGVYPVSTPRGTTASGRVVLPQGAIIDSAGFHISGTATASLGFGGNDYASLAGEFANDFTISFAGRVAIARGRINLRDNAGEMIAYADSLGFWPGNVFAVLPIPARLGIPSEDVAYIQLRNPSDTSQLLVETQFSGETVRLRSRPGQKVEISIPGLAQYASATPTLMADFDIVLNARTMRPISGGLQLDALPGQSLIPLSGLPVAITQLGFGADTGGFRLRAGAKAVLPGPLADVDLEFRNLQVSAQGLSGQIELGHYSEVFDASVTPIARARILGDTLAIAFTGAQLTLQPNNNRVQISGGITSALLKTPSGASRTINLAATVDANGFRGTADLSNAESPIPIGVAELTLQGAPGQPALTVTASATEFALILGGSIRLPTIAPGFSLGVENMKIGSAGVSVPNVSVTAPANTREFELFGARFALRDSTVGTTQVAPAIGIQVDQGIFRFTLSGYVTMLANTTRFIGLRFGTDGQFALQGASFLSRPIDIIPQRARLVSANIVSGGLELTGDVTLPAPFAQAPQVLRVRIMPDGQVTGGGKVVVINEPEGLATARTKLSIGIAAFHLRRLDLDIDLADASNTAVSVVTDVYIQEKAANLVRFGTVQGNTVNPGLRISAAGQVTWGAVAIPNPVALELGPVNLTLVRATSTTTPTGFAVAITGSLGLKVAGVSGSLAFRNVGFSSSGEVDVGASQIDGGTFEIQNVVRVVVGRLAWSDADTSLYVPLAHPPGANGEIQRDSTLVMVSSFVDLGASIDIAGVFRGGVDRFLVYVAQTDQTTHFLVQNLAVEIPGVIQLNANMSFDEYVDGFDFALSADGRLLSAYRFGMVGVLGKRGNNFRAGLFLRTSVTVPIVPGIVTLTEVGGGVFINPTANDLQLVKNVAGFSGPAANRVGMPPAGAFAVMLYAGFEVAGSNGVSAAVGRAMVTITDQAFQINATAAFFQMRDQIKGDLALQVGWTPAVYVRGDIALLISVPKTVRGTASIQFFAGSNVFAIKGNLDLMVIETVNAFAEVIIVPSGFTANLGFSVEKQTNVVGVKLAANLRIWYRPSTEDLGAYLRLLGEVKAFGITGRITLIGALVIQPEFGIYAQGTAQIVGVDVLRVDVWVQYTEAKGLAAGLGRNQELEQVIANAEQIAADLEAEADRILAGIDAAAMERARTPIAVPDSSLTRAFQNFQRWNWADLLGAWGLFRLGENARGGLVPNTAVDPYVAFYERTLTSSAAQADTAIIRQLREEAQQKLAIINDRRAAIEEGIRALRLELDASETAAAFIPPADPVTAWSSGTPTFVEGPTTLNGKPVLVLSGAPQFELDDQLSAAARSAMTAEATATAARASRLRAQIDRVETGLTTVTNATKATDPASFASYARLHSDAVDAIEHMHAANVDFRMRRRGWAQAALDTLAQQQATLAQRMSDRLLTITAYQNAQSTTDWVRRRGIAADLDALAKQRAAFLSAWSHDPSILAGYESQADSRRTTVTQSASALKNDPQNGGASANLDLAITFFQTQAVNFGMQDWWGVANSGLTQARDGAQALVDDANNAAIPVIRSMRDMHAKITSDLVELNRRQADLHGVLFDLYDSYLRTYGATDSTGQRMAIRKAALAELLQAPRVVSPQVTVTDFGYLSSINTTWTGTHPRGVYEYLIQDGNDSLFTVGAQGVARRWMYTTNVAGGSTPRNQVVSVRGGAGFTGSASTPYTVTFLRGSASNPSTQVAVPPVDLTAPNTPVVTITDLQSLPDQYGTPIFWTGDSSRIVARWSAVDPESGIAEYEYRVVTYPVPTGNPLSLSLGAPNTVVGLAPVQILPWTSAGGRTSAAIQGMILPANRLIRVEVRAKNGTGLVSGEGESSPVRYDPTRPVFAAGASIAPPMIAQTPFVSVGTYTPAGYTPPLLPVCGLSAGTKGSTAPKVWDGRLVTVTPDNAVVGGGAQASMTFSRPDASDPETGIAGYLYRVDSLAPTSVPASGWRDILAPGGTFTATGPDFVYGKPRWITLVALNQAGRFSAPLIYGPVTIPDPSGPTAPTFCGDYASNGIIAYMTTPGTDAETGVRGYQVRVRGPSGAIVRDFPAGATVDWPASQANAGNAFRLGFAPVLGGQHTVDLRAVNGLGVAGSVASSGQVMVDLTAAPVAGVTGAVGLSGATLQLTLGQDPESGLAGVDVAFGSTSSDPTLGGKTVAPLLVPYATYPSAVGTSTLKIPLPAAVLATPQIWVYVRVRNGAGLISNVTSVRIK